MRERAGAIWWTPLRVSLVVLGIALTAGYLQKLPCRDTSRWSEQFQFTHVCYTDVLASWTSYQLDSGAVPYFGFPTPYPPLTGAFMAVASLLSGVVPWGTRSTAYFDVSVLLLSMCAVVVVITTALLAGPGYRRAAAGRWPRAALPALMVAASPVVIFQAFTNWDLLAVALLGVAMVAWSRRSPAWAGVWLGLATGAKFWPLLLLLALLLLCLRAGRMREWTVTALITLATWAAVSVPLMIFAPEGFAEFWRTNVDRGADWDSVWLLVSAATEGGLDARTINLLVIGSLIIVTVAVALVVRLAPRRPRVAPTMFVLLALFMVVGKVFSPQDALWLTPLAALARPRWRAFLVWQATEVLLAVMRMYLLVGLEVPDRGLPKGWWYFAVGLRDITLLVLVAFVVREMLRPQHDVVRVDGVDDPAGGVLDESNQASESPASTSGAHAVPGRPW